MLSRRVRQGIPPSPPPRLIAWLGTLITAVGLSGCLLAGEQADPRTPTRLVPTVVRDVQATLAPAAVFQAPPTARSADAQDPLTRVTAPSASPTAAAARYVVQQGDSLFALARRFGVAVADLAGPNGLSPEGGLRTGQALVLPSGAWSSDLGVRVLQPTAGARVRSPVAVQGSAAAFEGAVVVEVLGPDGQRLAQTTTQARQPDAGIHGPFQASVELPPLNVERQVTLRVFWPSPRDGSARDEIRIPITVLPG